MFPLSVHGKPLLMVTTKPESMHSRSERKRFSPRRKATAALGYFVGAACLFWLFRDLNFGRLAQSLAGVDWRGLVAGVALGLIAYLCVAWEWRLLLQPAGSLPFRRAAQAVLAGRFANDVLPMQAGYLVRAFLASRWMRVSLAATLPSLIVERLWDGIWVALGIGLVSLFVPLPPDALQARNLLATTVLAGAIAVVAVVLLRGKASAGSTLSADSHGGLLGRVRLFVGRLADGMRDIIRSRLWPAVVGLSLLKLAVQALAFLAILQAWGFQLSIWAGLTVFLLGYLGICVPSTPAGTGLFQLFVVAGLGFFGIDKSAAAGFSLVSFVALTLPPALAGFFALARSGLTLRQIRHEIGDLK